MNKVWSTVLGSVAGSVAGTIYGAASGWAFVSLVAGSLEDPGPLAGAVAVEAAARFAYLGWGAGLVVGGLVGLVAVEGTLRWSRLSTRQSPQRGLAPDVQIPTAPVIEAEMATGR